LRDVTRRRNPRDVPASLVQLKIEPIHQLLSFCERFLIAFTKEGEAGTENVIVEVSYEDAILWHLALPPIRKAGALPVSQPSTAVYLSMMVYCALKVAE